MNVIKARGQGGLNPSKEPANIMETHLGKGHWPVLRPTASPPHLPFLQELPPVVEDVGDDGGKEAEQKQGRAGVHDGMQPCPRAPHCPGEGTQLLERAGKRKY